MSLWLLFDFLLLGQTITIPCFHLLGFITDKKVSWLSIFTVSLLFDWIIYSTHYVFFLGLCLLQICNSLFKKLSPHLKLTLLYWIFIAYLTIFLKHYTWSSKVYMTYLFLNLLLYFFIKRKKKS